MRCPSEAELNVNGESQHLRCLKRPHEAGLRVGIFPEGLSRGQPVWWNAGGRAASADAVQAELAPLAALAEQVPTPTIPATTTTIRTPSKKATQSKYDTAREKGYTGDACGECSSMDVVANGTCKKCMNCGATTGCS